MKPTHTLIIPGICALLFTSAGCSTVSTRTEQNPGALRGLSPADQALAEKGKIAKGFTPGAVYVAWGKPDARETSQAGGKTVETWTYYGFEQQTTPHPTMPRVSRPLGAPVLVAPVYSSKRYVRRQVTFENEKVVAWTATDSR